MARPSDDELILFFYGEHPAPGEMEQAMANDPALHERYAALAGELRRLALLDAPEPRAGLEGRMWARIAPELSPVRRSAARFGWQGWAVATCAVALVAVSAFLAGRSLRPLPTEGEAVATLKALSQEARDRVLAAALAEHLDSSERLIVEVSNGASSLEEERRFAEGLLSANRLYRRAAERAGQNRVAAVLAEIEPLLAQLAHAPAPSDLRRARERIASRDLLFKVRVTRGGLKDSKEMS